MRLHITNLYGIAGAAYAAMQNTSEIAKTMGANELGMYVYPAYTDSDEQLNGRMDGILAPMSFDDIVIMQYPSWNGKRYENLFVEKVRTYNDSKLIIFVHDVEKLMFNGSDDALVEEITLFNRADALILPSQRMHEYLKENGLRCNRVFIQKMWDYPMRDVWKPGKFSRVLHFLGKEDRFPFIKNWNQKTLLEVYGENENINEGSNVKANGFIPSNNLVPILNGKGGFGLIWADENQRNYYSYNQPFKLATYIAAGIPVLVQDGTVAADIVRRTGVGIVIESLDEADRVVQDITEKQYQSLCDNILKQQFPVINGHYTRKVLTDAVISVSGKNWTPEVKSTEDTVDYLLEKSCSLIRFGYGELDIICGNSVTFQEYDRKLARELEQVMGMDSNEQMMICIPDVFEGMERFTDSAAAFWRFNIRKNRSQYEYLFRSDWYGDSFVTRPYMIWKDKSRAGCVFDKWKQFWRGRDLLLVEGETGRTGRGNDLFENANSVSRIICPSRNAYSVIDEIYQAVLENAEDRLILVSLGPAAKILVSRLYKAGLRAVDLGHMDSEYEWFRMGSKDKVKLPNKHTAEYNFDEDIELLDDEDYESQIIKRIQ